MAAQNKKQTASSNTEASVPVVPPTAEVVAPIAEAAASPVAEVVEPPVDDLGARINSALEKTQSVITVSKELVAFFKTLQKDVAKLQKSQGKKPRRGASAGITGGAPSNRKPSGFAKPTAVSKELCDFLGVPTDRMLARTEVTRLLNKYIKDNSLQDPVDRRTIRPDGKLQKLLNIKGDMQLKYFNMQSYIKHHFIKAEPAVVAVGAV